MKKLILGTAVLMGACSMANANTITIRNENNCTYDLSIGGIGNSGPYVAVPGISSFTSSATTTISAVKIMFTDINGATIQLNLGNGMPSLASSAGLPAPSCPTLNNYVTAVWELMSNGDIVLSIL